MISFRCKPFYELPAHQLYAIMALRQEVFVVEQNCAYLDADGKDLKGYHLSGHDDDLMFADQRDDVFGLACDRQAVVECRHRCCGRAQLARRHRCRQRLLERRARTGIARCRLAARKKCPQT